MSKIINTKDNKSSKKEEDSNSINSESDSEKSTKNGKNRESKNENDENSEQSSAEEIHDSFGDKSEDSLNEDEDYNKLKDELDKANNFIDYFLVVGVDQEIYKNDWLYESDLDQLNNNYKEQLQPKIISSFPPFEKHTISFDDSLLMHCFPNGYKIIKKDQQPKPEIFSFILDNNFYNLNYPQKYLTCLICYENIAQYKILKEQEKQLDNEDTDDNENPLDKMNFNIKSRNTYAKIIDSLKHPDIYLPKCLLIMSLYPFFGEYEKIISELYNYSLGVFHNEKKNQVRTSLQRQKVIELLNYKKEIYTPIDKLIENLLIELPIPPRGFCTLEYTLNGEKRLIKQNKMNELPIININLKRIFVDFEIEDIISIYNYLFLEGRILFFSENIEILNIYIYGFLSLLYPFQYQYQIVTILPEQNFEIMESITPFIAGINQSFENDFFDKRGLTLSDAILVVDIDKYNCQVFNENTELPEFPKNAKFKLQKGLDLIVSKYLKEEKIRKTNSQQKANFELKNMIRHSLPIDAIRTESINFIKNEKQFIDLFLFDTQAYLSNFRIDYAFNTEINELFFNFNANLLSNYSKYLNLDFYSSNIMPCLEILFKVDDYLRQIPNNDKNFYDRFISETQLFGDFIYLRMIPKNTKEKIRILLFDEKINKNSENLSNILINMVMQTSQQVFTNSKEYEFTDKFEIQKPRKITENEINYYKKHKKTLLSYGIIIEEGEKKDEIKFFYPVFPKLTTKLFFQQNFHDYFFPNNWNESIEAINEDLISKSHLGGVSMRQNDMKNYIYLCWMQMWAMTFWYCDEIEQNYRFQKLLEVLSKTSCYEMEIFNLLFEALSKYGKNDNYVLKLYAILLKCHLNPSLKVHKIVMEIIEKKNLEGNFTEKLQMILKKERNKNYSKKGFRKRVFRSKYYPYIISEEIVFYAFDTCIICQNTIDLEEISKNYRNMTREVEWTVCPKCKNPILPKILIQFGKEINKSGLMNGNSSKYENVVLFSPYGLKNNYNTTLLKSFGIKINLDELILKYGGIFWDSLWYFKLNHLEYDFMIPYESKSKVEYINSFDIQKRKVNVNTIQDNYMDEIGFNYKDLEIEKYQLTIYKMIKKKSS